MRTGADIILTPTNFVGIGTTTPNEKLTVTGALFPQQQIYMLRRERYLADSRMQQEQGTSTSDEILVRQNDGFDG